jgi:hypothetical protein
MLKALEGRGQRVVSYVPMNGFILSVEGEARLGGLEVVSVSPLRASEKLSAEIGKGRAGKRGFVVEFHGQVLKRGK